MTDCDFCYEDATHIDKELQMNLCDDHYGDMLDELDEIAKTT